MIKKKSNVLNSIEKKFIINVFFIAVLLRIFMILLIYLYSDSLGEHLYIDDLKYETYAKVYSLVANNWFDSTAFKYADQYIGGVAVAQLYFRLNAILYYLTNSVLFLRIINIIFSSLTVIPMYLIPRELFGEKSAKISSVLWAIVPYHIIMSAFLFKDILIVLLTSSSLYLILRYYKTNKINVLFFLLLTIPLEWLRNGMPLFIVSILMLAFLIKKYENNMLNKYIKLLLVFSVLTVISVVLFFLFKDNINLLQKRLDIYMSLGREHSGNINFFRIDSIKQIYKLPLSWIFSTFMPLAFNTNLNNWTNVMGIFNYTLMFIAPAYIFKVLFKEKNKEEIIFLLPMLTLHLITIIAVINVPRHYYFLHFYIIIYGSGYIGNLNKKQTIEYLLICISGILILFFLSTIIV